MDWFTAAGLEMFFDFVRQFKRNGIRKPASLIYEELIEK
jgi:hypothetical protein